MKSRLFLTSLISFALHGALLLGLQSLSRSKNDSRATTSLSSRADVVISIRLLPANRNAAPDQATQRPQNSNRQASRNPSNAQAARQYPGAKNQPVTSHSADAVAPTSPDIPSVTPVFDPPATITAPVNASVHSPESSETPGGEVLSPELTRFARGYARKMEAESAFAPPAPPGTPEKHKRSIDKLYARSGRASQQVWEEYRGTQGTSVVRFAAGTCSKIAEPTDHEHRHLNKVIQVVGCPD
jgi:hypothetical protein